ncbi:MAG: hypothetical protein AB8G99_26300 [Planctomycetaceae bacterium]
MSKSFDRILIAVVAIGTLAIVPNLFRFERTHGDWSEENAKRIALMSENQRSDLKANAQRLNSKLSEEKREAVRAIHEAVADPGTSERLDAYHAWLQDLDIVERDSVRSSDSIEKKVTQIQNLMSDEEQRSQGFAINLDDGRIKRFRGEEFTSQLKFDMEQAGIDSLWISDREYDAMLDVMVEGYPEEIQAEFKRGLADLAPDAPDAERFRLRSNALAAAMFQWMQKKQSPAPFDEKFVDPVIDQIEESAVREPLKQLTDEQRSTLVGIMRYRSLDRSRFLAVYFPSKPDVAAFYKELPRAEQIQLMSISAHYMRPRLNLMYVARKENVPDDIREMAESILERMDRKVNEPGRRRRPHERGGPRGERERGERRSRPGAGPPKVPSEAGVEGKGRRD